MIRQLCGELYRFKSDSFREVLLPLFWLEHTTARDERKQKSGRTTRRALWLERERDLLPVYLLASTHNHVKVSWIVNAPWSFLWPHICP